ncbi:rRNA N6-adenosine-methyltransferase zcchc4 [Homalodisca vitripennis]|nr:rRNA N6-adenosine-methyltransferase zcchc4 [Homalodisca vitripennis]
MAGKKGRKLGSPVRMFTNIVAREFVLPRTEGYWLCKPCAKWASPENRHCVKCKACTSKVNAIYDGMSKLKNWSHCFNCERCLPLPHTCSPLMMAERTSIVTPVTAVSNPSGHTALIVRDVFPHLTLVHLSCLYLLQCCRMAERTSIVTPVTAVSNPSGHTALIVRDVFPHLTLVHLSCLCLLQCCRMAERTSIVTPVTAVSNPSGHTALIVRDVFPHLTLVHLSCL